MGLTSDPMELLRSYEDERRAWAERVVNLDKRCNQQGLPFETVFNEMKEQVVGCGMEEKPGLLVSEKNDAVNWQSKDRLTGVLRTGRRLFNVRVTRWVDQCTVDLHEEFPSDGRYRILVIVAKDSPRSRSRAAIEAICALTRQYSGMVKEIVLQPNVVPDLAWHGMPAELRKQAEMRLYIADREVYETFSMSQDAGAIASKTRWHCVHHDNARGCCRDQIHARTYHIGKAGRTKNK